MRALDSMLSKMKATNLYSLAGDTLVDYELQAYAQGLDFVYDAFNELEKESYIPTASGYGLCAFENALGISASGGLEERRNAAMSRCAITPNHFTRADMENVFSMVGVHAQISEYTAEKKIYVNCMDTPPESAMGYSVRNAARLFLPAHLNAELDFRCVSWNNIDGMDETFDARDEDDYTWDAIDNYGNAVIIL